MTIDRQVKGISSLAAEGFNVRQSFYQSNNITLNLSVLNTTGMVTHYLNFPASGSKYVPFETYGVDVFNIA